jgi:hypothetical protein
MPDVNSIPFKQADPNGHYRGKQLPNDSGDFMEMLGLPAFAGDVVGPGGVTPGQSVIFSDSTGKRIDAATQTGLAKLSGGVLSSVPAPAGIVVGTTDPQTLTNKTLINPTLEGVTGFDKDDVGLGNVDNTSDANKPVSGPQQAALDLKEDKNKKGVANGYASLDASTKIPLSQIPDSVVGASQYQGTWNAATNVPAIPAAAIGNKGWYYSVSVAGTTNINGINSWAVGDEIISNGSVWQKIVNVSAVNSVNGYTGVVVLGKGDVGLGNVDNTSDVNKPVSTATVTQLNLKEDKANKNVANGYAGLDATGKVPAANVPADLVTSVAAKQGVVTLVKGDVGLGNVDNTSDATKNSATATLTGKTINGASNTLTVRLANDVTGNLPVTNLNAGTGANSGSFWRGDGQWAPPAGGGDVVGPASAVDGDVTLFSGTTGKIIKTTGVQLSSLATSASVANNVTGQASSVDGEVTLFSGTGGKTIKRATGTGIPIVTNGVWGTPQSVLPYANFPVGAVLKVVTVKQVGMVANSTTNFPADGTIPQISEGQLLFTLPAITMAAATNKVVIQVNGSFSTNPIGGIIVALFRNSVVDAVAATLFHTHASGVGYVAPFHLSWDEVPGAGTHTYTLRFAGMSNSTYINGASGGDVLGGVVVSTMTGMEVKA